MKLISKKNQQEIINYIQTKIDNININEDVNLQKYEIIVIIQTFWKLHMIKTKFLNDLLINLNKKC